jgi:hypothetical protein
MRAGGDLLADSPYSNELSFVFYVPHALPCLLDAYAVTRASPFTLGTVLFSLPLIGGTLRTPT